MNSRLLKNDLENDRIGRLCLFDFASLDRLNRYPHALNLATWELDADALNIGLELTAGVLDETRTDTAAFLGQTLTDDTTAFNGAFTCDCANS